MKKLVWIALLTLLFSLSGWRAAEAQQSEELRLSLSRDWGYGGAGEIQGLFSMRVQGPADLVRVVFWIDDQSIGEDTQAPFRLQFTTDDYPPGVHTLSATGYTAQGRELRSNQITLEFVSAEKARQVMWRLLGPTLGLVVIVILAAVLAPLSTARRRKQVPLGAPRKYGFTGGAICPRCGRPFPLPLFGGLNIGPWGKFMACPHCGKWAAMRPRPLEELRLAEQAELAQAGQQAPAPPDSEAEKLRKALEDSKYQQD